jgi:hypothetical protein
VKITDIKSAVETTVKALPELVKATEALIELTRKPTAEELLDEDNSLEYGRNLWQSKIKAMNVIEKLDDIT